jgi:hypothetical protein
MSKNSDSRHLSKLTVSPTSLALCMPVALLGCRRFRYFWGSLKKKLICYSHSAAVAAGGSSAFPPGSLHGSGCLGHGSPPEASHPPGKTGSSLTRLGNPGNPKGRNQSWGVTGKKGCCREDCPQLPPPRTEPFVTPGCWRCAELRSSHFSFSKAKAESPAPLVTSSTSLPLITLYTSRATSLLSPESHPARTCLVACCPADPSFAARVK